MWTVLPQNSELRLRDVERLDALVVTRAKAANTVNCGGRGGKASSTALETMIAW